MRSDEVDDEVEGTFAQGLGIPHHEHREQNPPEAGHDPPRIDHEIDLVFPVCEREHK
jgi:hypothetical protein